LFSFCFRDRFGLCPNSLSINARGLPIRLRLTVGLVSPVNRISYRFWQGFRTFGSGIGNLSKSGRGDQFLNYRLGKHSAAKPQALSQQLSAAALRAGAVQRESMTDKVVRLRIKDLRELSMEGRQLFEYWPSALDLAGSRDRPAQNSRGPQRNEEVSSTGVHGGRKGRSLRICGWIHRWAESLHPAVRFTTTRTQSLFPLLDGWRSGLSGRFIDVSRRWPWRLCRPPCFWGTG
jgi:hypothetical protein